MFIYFYLIIVTITLWFLEKDYYGAIWVPEKIMTYLGQISGFLAIVFLSLNYIISARYSFVENLIGGLDRQYRLHMYTGIAAFFLIILHPLLLALPSLEVGSFFQNYFIPFRSNSFGQNLGILSFWLFTILLFISSSKKLSYAIWKLTHSVIGIPFLLIAAHTVLLGSSMEYMPLEIWTALWLGLGIWSFIYKVFLYDFIGPVYRFQIEKIERPTELLHELYLKPIDGKAYHYKPGQFSFVQILNKDVSLEPHPFTMSSTADENFLQFSIKELGDWSKSMEKVKVGDKVKVTGPYGHFTTDNLRDSKKQVWIGGGIGITPFLSKIRSELKHKSCENIYLIYSERNKENASFIHEITKLDDVQTHLKSIIHFSDEQGFLSADQISEWVDGFEDTIFLMCGPKPMTESLSKQLISNGISPDDIIFEFFDFK